MESSALPVMDPLESMAEGNQNVASTFEIGSKSKLDEKHLRLGASFNFRRQTAVTLEPRGIIADYSKQENTLTIWHSHQSPHLVQVLIPFSI